ncbi:MAG: serine/threonine protein kinase [Planctomycetes bacterium]|nr:serine/threonine protein kinase [Planctomycetota bacterium]MCB9884585.1 serine/threonine protein kinase [Planctomycetota bacterium]
MPAAAYGPDEPTRELSRAFEIAARLAGLPPHLREIALQSAVGSDQILERAVRDLLRAGPATPAPSPPRPATSHHADADFGRYLLCERLGEGSMGVVHRAVHVDTGRSVALKLLRGGHASDAMLRRFRSELTMLARLRHPGIVDVLDAGYAEIDSNREPFLVMELVEGPPLLSGADELGLDQRARVGLVISLCEATAYAHRRGVIHRDLKPENVRLEVDVSPPRARILDFGVATPTSTITHTAANVVGTFGYMAPEQLDGEVDLRSDVFGLGAIAYELLTGAQAVPARGLPVVAALHLTRTHVPVPANRMAAGIDADLTAVLAKALARDPEQRYASADQFGGDLQRWLAGEPVQARPHTALYLFCRFVQRRRLLTGLAVALLVAISLSVAMAVGGYASAYAANRDLRTLLGGTLEELRNIADNGGRPTSLPEDVTSTVQRMVERAPNDLAVRRIQAELLHLQSDLARANGRLDDALTQRRDLLRISAELAKRDPSVDNLRLQAIAHVLVGDILKEAANGPFPAEVSDQYHAAHELFERIVEIDPQARRPRDDLGHSCLRLAFLEGARGNGNAAWDWLSRAEPVVTELAHDFPDHPYTHGLLREFFGINANLLQTTENAPAPPELTAQILEHIREARRRDPDNLVMLLMHLSAARGHALSLATRGDRAQAAQVFDEADRVAELLGERDAHSWSPHDELLMLRIDEAVFALGAGDVGEALRRLYGAELALLQMVSMRELPHLTERLHRFGETAVACLCAVEKLDADERARAMTTAGLLQSGFGLLVAELPQDRDLRIVEAWLAAVAGGSADAERTRATIEEARRQGWYDDRLWLAEILLLERSGRAEAARSLLGAPPAATTERVQAALPHTRRRLAR